MFTTLSTCQSRCVKKNPFDWISWR